MPSRGVTLVSLLIVLGTYAFSDRLLTAASQSPPPRTYYVSTTGSDRNSGTLRAPWQTLRNAVAHLHAGDTLYIRGGTYVGATNEIDSSQGTVRGGTSWSNPITIAGSPSETVVLQPPPSDGAIGLLTSTQQYIIFQDLVIDGSLGTVGGGQLIYESGGANHIRYLRLEVKNSYGFGMHISNNNGNAPFNEILDSSIHNNGRERSPSCGCQQHGIYVFTSDNLIEGNDIYANSGYGIHIYNSEGPLDAARNIVRKNRIHGNNTNGQSGYGLVFAWGDGNIATDNLIYGNRGGVQLYTNSTNAKVYQNTIYDNRPLHGVFIQFARNSVVRDNIVYGNGIDILNLGSSTTLSNNTQARGTDPKAEQLR